MVMKSLSLLLILNIIFCYTGLSTGVCCSIDTPNIARTNCHTTHQDNVSNMNATGHSYKNPDEKKHEISMCQDALTNAPNGHYFDLRDIGYSVPVSTPNLETNRVFNSPLKFEIKKQYRLPDLFLLNSSFLL